MTQPMAIKEVKEIPDIVTHNLVPVGSSHVKYLGEDENGGKLWKILGSGLFDIIEPNEKRDSWTLETLHR